MNIGRPEMSLNQEANLRIKVVQQLGLTLELYALQIATPQQGDLELHVLLALS